VDTLMIPIVPTSKTTMAVALQTPADKKTGANFSDYMEKKLVTEVRRQNNLFGLAKDKAAPVSAALQASPVALAPQKGPEGTATVAALLGQFVQYLQKSAMDQQQGPGEWSFPAPGPELLQKIARDAGMNEGQLNTLMEKTKSPDGKLSVVAFLDSFARHFQTLQDEMPVTAPETDLPLLQILFERLGMPVSEVSRISEAAVRGDNTFDLQKVADLLQGLSGERITDLTAVEAEQLQDLLAGAGVSGQLQRALLPERLPVIEGLVESGPPVTLTLDRLKNMLAQGVREVKANRLQADPLSFLADLQTVLARSEFATNGPRLSSAVQGTLAAVFEKLLESVDLARVKVSRGSEVAESVLKKKDLSFWRENIAGKADVAAPVGATQIERPFLPSPFEPLGAPVSEVSLINEAAVREEDNTFALPKMANLLPEVIKEKITELGTEVNRISQAAVRGDNTLALQKVAALLQVLTGKEITGLTVGEVEQLPQAKISEGLPAVEGLVASGPPLTPTLDQLKNMLTQAVREVKPERLQAEPLSFLTDLQEMLTPSAGSTNSPPPSPAMQGALAAVFAGLIESVDLAKVKVVSGSVVAGQALEKKDLGLWQGNIADQEAVINGKISFAENTGLSRAEAPVAMARAEAGAAADVADQTGRPFLNTSRLPQELRQASALAEVFVEKKGEVFVTEAAAKTEQLPVEGRNAPISLVSAKETGISGELFAENIGAYQSVTATLARAGAMAPTAAENQAARPMTHIPNLPQGLQQQGFAQLSQGVLQGLRNQEHHLVLKLYPKELGEVKVEMTVRDNQVALSFAMENARVKETLESNLGQFKENMEKQGFTLGDCTVSLNRDNDGNEAWQKFQSVSLEKEGGRRRTTLADLPDDILYQRVQPGNGRESGVDLFA